MTIRNLLQILSDYRLLSLKDFNDKYPNLSAYSSAEFVAEICREADRILRFDDMLKDFDDFKKGIEK